MNTILITGTNRGLGLELTRQFGEGGWRVLACCRQPDRAEALQVLARKTPTISIHPLDVADPEQIARISHELREQSIDILLNNAGIFGPRDVDFGTIGPAEVAAWLQVFATNSIGPLLVTQAFVDQVARSPRKLVAIISSRGGSLGDNRSGGMTIYRSSKAAVNQVMLNLSHALRDRDITVVGLHPGWVQTDMGGAEAPLTPATSVRGLKRVLEQLTPAQTGQFLGYDGVPVPW
jgi:NAD(P)-dependent dehydrogenase (short-subunit alcohol dehydrogenase family)